MPKPPTSAREIYLVIRNAMLAGETSAPPILSGLTQPQWESLVWLANNQFALVDLHYCLGKLNALQLLRAEETDFIDECVAIARQRESEIPAQIEQITMGLENVGVQVVLLKGAAIIASHATLGPGHRFLSDIDFIVPASKLDDAYKALMEMGYQSELSLPDPVSEYWVSKHLPAMTHSAYNHVIECHQRPLADVLLRSFPLDAKMILDQYRTVEPWGFPVRVPHPEHLIVHAFIHSQFVDGYELQGLDNYRAMIDVSNIVRNNEKSLDWALLHSLMKKSRAVSSFALFVERISCCVDNAAVNWPVTQPGAGLRRTYYRFVHKHSLAGGFIAGLALLCRRRIGIANKNARKERSKILEANPHPWKYNPLLVQLFSLTALKEKANEFFQKLR